MTEKSLRLASSGMYTFAVDMHANKKEIAREIEKLYNVHVVLVRTASMHGKTRRIGKKLKTVKKSDWKKAIVKLKDGETIDIYEVAPEGN